VRHIGTLIAAIVIAPLAWILLAFGQDRSLQAFASAQSTGVFHPGDFVRPVQMLAAAGLLVGLLATLRFSPLGASLTGIAYTSSYVLLLAAPGRVLRLFGHDISVAGHHADASTPIRTGTTMLLGALLLVGVASIGRWRRWPQANDKATAEAQDLPLGIDGLGLPPRPRSAEPEFVARYSTGAGQAGSQRAWATSSREE
jgi:hypothetical protein